MEIRGLSVYPGQPIVCAAALTYLFPNLEAAAALSDHGWSAAEGSRSPGAGGQNRKAIDCLRRYQTHGDFGKLLFDLEREWIWTVRHQEPYKDRQEEGITKGRELVAYLEEVLPGWCREEGS